ncbi:MAG: hypothetical protein ABSG65_30120 [Bryobacteraceae bacterium]|jgi:hypothetical protein
MSICGALVFALCGAAAGQTAQPAAASDGNAMERMAQRVEELQNELNQLKEQIAKSRAASDTAPASPVPASPAAVANTAVAAQPAEPPAPPAPPEEAQADDDQSTSHKLGPFRMQGFSDITFGRPVFNVLPNGVLYGSTNSFSLGDFDLFVTAKLSEHLSYLAELLVTSDFTNEFSAELDRMMLTYKFSDYLKVSVGKFNTAIGYYSNAFGRARYFQTATGRPIMYTDEDDGGILPVHSIGMTSTGQVPSGPLGLQWVAEIANGRASLALSDPSGPVESEQNFADENNLKAVNFALIARPPALQGFEAGISFYRDHLRPNPFPDTLEHIPSAHIVFVRPGFEFLNEAAMVQHIYVGGGHEWNSLTGYTQLSHKLGHYRPYFRYDYQNVPKTEPFFGQPGQVGFAEGPSVGVRYDLADYAELKCQYGRLLQRNVPWSNDFEIQAAFAF